VLRYANYTYDPVEDNWRTPTAWGAEGGQLIPELRCFTPTYEVSPSSAEHGARWITEIDNIGLISITHEPADFSWYIGKVYDEQDFDMYMVFWGLSRFPNHLYSMLHSSQDVLGAYNAPGINDPALDALLETVKFSLNHTARIDAAWEIQEWLYDYNHPLCAFSYMQLYSRVYFDSFNPGLRGIVNSPGYASNNMWTFLNMHWETGHPHERIENGNDAVIWCLEDEPELLNPLSASTTYSWQILDRIYDPLMAINPWTHDDLSWLADSWEMVETPSGMNITFWLNSTAEWQDGNSYTAEDARYNWLFLRDNAIPRYTSAWEHIVDVEILTPGVGGVARVILNVTSQFLIYDLASTAALLPPPVWSWLDVEPLQDILAYDPSTNTTAPSGAGPRFGTADCPTQLYGTGPFIFDFYDQVENLTDLYANRYYFKTTDEIQAQLVELFWVCGDVNRDGVVDQADQDRYAAAYGSTIGEPNWDPDCDVNSDGVINEEDGIIISYFMGKQRGYPAEIVDVAILEAIASPTVVVMGQTINISTIVKNKGNAGFTTNFTYYYNNTFLASQTVTNLIPCHNTTLQYTWNTTGMPAEIYTISVNATVLEDADANLTDNTLIGGTIAITYVDSNATLADVTATRNALNFTSSGPSGETAYVNTTMPVGLNKTAISVFIDDVKLEPPPFPIITTNGTHYFIYFEFTQSIHNVTIQYAITDMAVTNVATSKTIVGQGYSLLIYVTVENQGNYAESFNVTVYYNETAIILPDGKNYTTITLPSGNSTVITLPWNTTGVAKDNYTITAKASQLPYETDTTDNTHINGEVYIGIPGDLDADNDVDPDDLDMFAVAYGTSPLSNPNCDIDGDDDIDPQDLYIFSRDYGKTDP